MAQKILKVDFEKCTGCRLCELVCAVKHHNVSNPARSRIRIIKWESEGIYVPMVCQQCEDAPCVAACPAKALSRNPETGRVELDYDKCIGCRTCVSVCPFGAIQFVDEADLGLHKSREAARRIRTAEAKAGALQAG
jgi:carbon-monoxide dehydrogenase iron sulfur subunit